MAPDELLCTSLELQLEARDLPNLDFGSLSDPFAVLSVSNGDTWEEYGKVICLHFASMLKLAQYKGSR